MIRWALLFLLLAPIAAVFGFSGIGGEKAWIAQVLFFACILLALVSLAFDWDVKGRHWDLPPSSR